MRETALSMRKIQCSLNWNLIKMMNSKKNKKIREKLRKEVNYTLLIAKENLKKRDLLVLLLRCSINKKYILRFHLNPSKSKT